MDLNIISRIFMAFIGTLLISSVLFDTYRTIELQNIHKDVGVMVLALIQSSMQCLTIVLIYSCGPSKSNCVMRLYEALLWIFFMILPVVLLLFTIIYLRKEVNLAYIWCLTMCCICINNSIEVWNNIIRPMKKLRT
jgi:mannose/fructose/N-acetylgalactosamine-specific phosphotransferase system component IID